MPPSLATACGSKNQPGAADGLRREEDHRRDGERTVLAETPGLHGARQRRVEAYDDQARTERGEDVASAESHAQGDARDGQQGEKEGELGVHSAAPNQLAQLLQSKEV